MSRSRRALGRVFARLRLSRCHAAREQKRTRGRSASAPRPKRERSLRSRGRRLSRGTGRLAEPRLHYAQLRYSQPDVACPAPISRPEREDPHRHEHAPAAGAVMRRLRRLPSPR
jgi:hypothetical protein